MNFRQRKNLSGFTLTELLVTMVLIGILSAVAYANFVDWRQDARIKLAIKFAYDMHAAISMKDYYVQLECNALKVSLGDIQNNDVTTDTCPTSIPITQRKFVNMDPNDYPENPMTSLNSVTTCSCISPCDTSCYSVNAGYCFHPIARTFFAIQLGCRGPSSTTGYSQPSQDSGSDTSGTDSEPDPTSGTSGSTTDGGTSGGTSGDTDGGSGTGDTGSSDGGGITTAVDECEE